MVKQLITRYLKRRHLLMQSALKQRYLVIDLELTGLDPKQHEIVSVAWVLIDNECIKNSQSQHLVNKEVKSLEQSPVFHGISTDSVAQGQSLQSIITSLSTKKCRDHPAPQVDYRYLTNRKKASAKT
jgi:DNA polymerase-3 subunit epsilon